jgi:hypothetical protein
MNLEFRPLLQILEVNFGTRQFSTKEVLASLHDPDLMHHNRSLAEYVQEVSPISLKRVSSDLNKLYRMGFVNRVGQERQVKTKAGKICNKGWAYDYSLNRQGHSYVWNYLWNPNPKRQRKEFLDTADFMLKEYNKQQSGSLEESEARWALFKSIDPSPVIRPIDKRFPVRHDPYLIDLLMRVTNERDQLKKELQDVRRQIEELKSSA